jgi:hypothetical protein
MSIGHQIMHDLHRILGNDTRATYAVYTRDPAQSHATLRLRVQLMNLVHHALRIGRIAPRQLSMVNSEFEPRVLPPHDGNLTVRVRCTRAEEGAYSKPWRPMAESK